MPVRLLFIAYFFPPIGGAGTQRSLKFVRYLPSFNFEPTVLTGPGSTGGRWCPEDETFQREIPPSVRVLRVRGPEPQTGKWMGRLRRTSFLNSEWDRWWVAGVQQAAETLDDLDVIFATGPPYATLEAAAALARKLGRPWLADLRDLWALDEMEIYPTAVHRRVETVRMERVLRSSAAIVTTAPEATAALKHFVPSVASRTLTITNGYDASDFVGAPPRRTRNRFRIVHTGYLSTQRGLSQRCLTRRLLGGGRRDVDILTRSHVYLLRAIDRLLADDASLATRLEVCLAGVLSHTDYLIARKSPLCRVLGYLTHADAIDLMRSADLLFLPMQNRPGRIRSTTIPGKTFEYLASGTPILAAVPHGDARDILLAGGADVCVPDDVLAMAAAIRRHVDMNMALDRSEAKAQAAVEAFERSQLTSALASVLRKLLDEEALTRASTSCRSSESGGSRPVLAFRRDESTLASQGTSHKPTQVKAPQTQGVEPVATQLP